VPKRSEGCGTGVLSEEVIYGTKYALYREGNKVTNVCS
jgi:hypothetical protein